jgi:hypothetical protein
VVKDEPRYLLRSGRYLFKKVRCSRRRSALMLPMSSRRLPRDAMPLPVRS